LTLKHPIFFLLLLAASVARSQGIEFVENKGQWDSKVLYAGRVPAGTFFIHRDGFTVLQHNDKELHELQEMAHTQTLQGKPIPPNYRHLLHSHAYRVRFEASNPKASIIADKSLPTVNNYLFGNDPSKWAQGCRVFQGITVHDLYPGIDVRYYSERGTLKYDMIVSPGADPSAIAMRYEGVDKLETKKGELHIGTSVGTLRELEPYTYQYDEKAKVTIPVRFKVVGNMVSFVAEKYNKKAPLIIDPTLIFCSFSGSTADNWGFTATPGPDGSFFGGGIVFANGFPTSNGAFQQTYQGGTGAGCFGGSKFDIGIIKLSPDGLNRIYATYIGGSGDEMPHSLISDPQGNLVVAGKTNSNNFPGSSIGSSGTLSENNWDIYVLKLNATGSALIGSVRVGGSSNDGSNITPCAGGAGSLKRNYGDWSRSEVILDNANNVYLASATQSTNFPTVNPIQNSNGGGANTQDGVVLKFNPNLSSLLFSTYLGGNGNDAAYVLSINPLNGDIYVAGGTESTQNFPGSTAGTIGTVNNGGPTPIDGFISVLSNDGSVIRRSTFIGTTGIDQIYGIQFDRAGFPYIMGQTTGAWPIINALWSQPNSRQFIAKLRPDLSAFVYSTAFGKGDVFSTAPDISPVAFLVDRCENVYVSGFGGSIGTTYPSAGAQGLPVTPDAIKASPDLSTVPGSTLGQGRDFYFFVLKRNAESQLYGSYFGQNDPANTLGGDHVDGGTSRFDQNGAIYQGICASCGSNQPFPTTPPVWADTKGAGATCNLAMVKIEFNFAGVGSGVQSSIAGVPRDTAGCVPLTVDFSDTLLQAVKYYWDFGDGNTAITTMANASNTYLAVGTYRVRLIAEDSSTCNIRDTSYLNIRVGASQALPSFTPRRIDTCTLFRYEFTNTSVAPAGYPFRARSFVWDFGDGSPRDTTSNGTIIHQYQNPGTYRVKLYLIDTLYCNAPDSVEAFINVAALVRADFKVPSTACAPFEAQFENTSSGGLQFFWDFGDGTTSTDRSPVHTFSAGTWTITLTAVDSGSCNISNTKQFTINVLGNPTAGFIATPQPPVVNTPITFDNTSSADAIRFKWKFGDGDSLQTASRAPIQHEYNATGTFNACLIAYNQAGCPDTLCLPLRTQIEPALDIPNAFTPLSKDNNSKVFLRGFGIAKMRFTIWNRYGQKVFETNDKRIGWDGTFNGQLQPMDVYAYTVEVEFFDGTKATKKGDITLIR
jgi:gliding motility-associated-like protein